MTVIHDTMVGIVNALGGGGWVHHSDVTLSVVVAGGKPRQITDAAKRLRDMGFPIVVNQRRQHTEWRMDPSDPEQERYHQRILRDAYSEVLSYWKALDGAQVRAPQITTAFVLRDVETAVISLGRAMGKSLTEISGDLVAQTMAPMP